METTLLIEVRYSGRRRPPAAAPKSLPQAPLLPAAAGLPHKAFRGKVPHLGLTASVNKS